MSLLSTYLIVYGILALGHLVVQMTLGHLEYRRQKRLPFDPDFTPPVTVVVPVYNEELDVLYDCLRSIDGQDYPGYVEALVVDDGSPNRERLLTILEEFAGGRFRVLLKDNSGKRHTQRAVLDEAAGEIIVTIDSDTIIEPDGVTRLVQRFTEPGVGAVTGLVLAENLRENLLTRLIGYRYWTAFNQERAAQSMFRVVMCCSGPFSAYRKSMVDSVKDAYVTQSFLGETCTFGDDRHLTNLVLQEGAKVVFDGRARSRTYVPTTLGGYVRQQTRWNKSFYREMLWTLKFAHRRHPYMLADLLLQAFLPFMLLGALGAMVFQTLTDGPHHLVQYVAMIVAIAFARSLYGLLRTRDPGFLTFIVYGFLHVLVLIPVRLYALATMRRTHWGTRSVVMEG